MVFPAVTFQCHISDNLCILKRVSISRLSNCDKNILSQNCNYLICRWLMDFGLIDCDENNRIKILKIDIGAHTFVK